jgi:hypothetical protein
VHRVTFSVSFGSKIYALLHIVPIVSYCIRAFFWKHLSDWCGSHHTSNVGPSPRIGGCSQKRRSSIRRVVFKARPRSAPTFLLSENFLMSLFCRRKESMGSDYSYYYSWYSRKGDCQPATRWKEDPTPKLPTGDVFCRNRS